MLQKSFKYFVKLALFMSIFLGTSAFAAYGAIMGNNSFSTAYPIGHWKYHGSTTTQLEPDQDEAYYSFTVNAGERVYVDIAHDTDDQGRTLEVFDRFQNRIDIGTRVVRNEFGRELLFASNVNGTSSSQRFYIKVTRGNYVGDMFFSVSINNRIRSEIRTFEFQGRAVNAGNPDFLSNPDGVDSSIISMDLTNNSNVPEGAIVKSIGTKGYLSKSLGGVENKVSPAQNNIWYPQIGQHNISTTDNLIVAQRWDFVYNFKGTSSSYMTNVKATINYEFDLTNLFVE